MAKTIDAADIEWESVDNGEFEMSSIITSDGCVYKKRDDLWFDITDPKNEFQVKLNLLL